jgi:subtilisin family serine protease
MILANLTKFLFVTESARGYHIGKDCYDFPGRTVCLHEDKPFILPYTATLYPNEVIKVDWNTAEDTGPEQYLLNLDGKCQRQAPWHLARIWRKDRITGDNYPFDYDDGKNVNVYILDTWVSIDHPRFNGRAKHFGRFGVPPHDPRRSDTSHGTHVAGLVGAWGFGTARASQLLCVQVLDDGGFGDFGSMIQALDRIQKHQRETGKNSVINLSVGGPKSTVINNVLEDLQRSGNFIVVVAAGNENQDAGRTSPASANVVTVGATTLYDQMAPFSNFGSSVKILAPGSSIQSLCPEKATCWMSGTSMASPIVAGVAATIWSQQPAMNSVQITDYLLGTATKGVLKDVKPQTKNKLVFIKREIKC